jgi:hypothetical protein
MHNSSRRERPGQASQDPPTSTPAHNSPGNTLGGRLDGFLGRFLLEPLRNGSIPTWQLNVRIGSFLLACLLLLAGFIAVSTAFGTLFQRLLIRH